jgi:hypothetical protein
MKSLSIRAQILDQFTKVAEEQNRRLAPLADDLPLLHSGLDSLCLAVIVARLEDALEIDPFTTTESTAFPVTVGEFIDFYEKAIG